MVVAHDVWLGWCWVCHAKSVMAEHRTLVICMKNSCLVAHNYIIWMQKLMSSVVQFPSGATVTVYLLSPGHLIQCYFLRSWMSYRAWLCSLWLSPGVTSIGDTQAHTLEHTAYHAHRLSRTHAHTLKHHTSPHTLIYTPALYGEWSCEIKETFWGASQAKDSARILELKHRRAISGT